MPAIFNAQVQSQRNWAVAVALLLVYVVWGTTYFAIGIALQTMPPLLMNAIRFLCAGGVMLAIAIWQGHALPTREQWRNCALVGGLMVFLAMNFIGFAQKLGIGSGLMATVVTTMPMWLALWSRGGGEHVPLTSWIGLALGVVGALLLALEGDFSATWLGALLAFGAPLCWSIGSYASRKLSLPAPAMASAAQWFAGGAMGLVVALWFEPLSSLGHVSAKSWAAWVYLLVFGTLVALNAYLWLLQNTSAALAGSYSFVNPAVALLVGVVLGGELLTGWVYAALPLIGAALAFILYGPALQRWWGGQRVGHPRHSA
ncbi:EamA family transporter [Acidovorax radicis]|jgi:drug/metabolite transporter (DMT)-like permease|uniref:EamA family transporter n=1 Tax=Acidovorax radicis TaxID=758826 RepID=UPI001CFA3E1D|nr:EamA family transporter [Acidovorax radicis]UCU99712.1 EamA family transporter [Acidovorax radicis]